MARRRGVRSSLSLLLREEEARPRRSRVSAENVLVDLPEHFRLGLMPRLRRGACYKRATMSEPRKRSRSLHKRLASLAERPMAERVAVIGVLMVCFLGWYTVYTAYASSHPDIWPYLNRAFLPLITAVTAGFLGVWCALTGIAISTTPAVVSSA